MRALSACSGDVHFARVHVIALVVDVVCLMLVLSACVTAVVIAFPYPVFCSTKYTLDTPVGDSKLRWLLPN